MFAMLPASCTPAFPGIELKMNHTEATATSPVELLHVCRRYWRRWVIPAVTVAVLAAVYATLRSDTWEASQTLFVRNEAVSSDDSPGKFRHDDEMKITQETIMQVVLSRAVLHGALEKVGPPADHKANTLWPSQRDVENLREVVKLAPPKGAEFGTTEVFYLKVRDKDRQRAAALATAICDQLSTHLQRLRETKAGSMIGELEKSVELAEADLKATTDRLAQLEREVGTDLAELRILHQDPADTSDLRRKVIDMENDLRAARSNVEVNDRLLQLLQAAQSDPGQLLAMPNRLLESLPALRRLKDGLIDAQLRTSQLLGSMSKDHPRVQAALVAEREIGQHIYSELSVAIRSLEVERELNQQRVASLLRQLDEARGRLERLAGLRAEYSNLVAAVEQQTRIVEDARRNLSQARASQAGAAAASLIGRVDGPVIGSKPVGPSRKAIMAGGLAGGLAFGLGLLVLTVPAGELVHRANVKKPAVSSGHTAPAPAAAVAATARHESAGVLSLKDALRRVAATAASN